MFVIHFLSIKSFHYTFWPLNHTLNSFPYTYPSIIKLYFFQIIVKNLFLLFIIPKIPCFIYIPLADVLISKGPLSITFFPLLIFQCFFYFYFGFKLIHSDAPLLVFIFDV